MEGLNGQLRAMVNGWGVGALTPLQPGQLPTLQPPTTEVQPLQPLQPGQMPVVYDPISTGYANLQFAAMQQKYTDQKVEAMQQARQMQEAAAASVVRAEAAQNNFKAAAIGAGVVMLAIKFLL